ncbi:MAG TPA: FAD binding domain-containing protein [Mycobacteriales bacterium]|nr:FAD binding domain-containing protein [Mycobacteriales bacterium]
MKPFTFLTPTDAHEAVALMAEHGTSARLIAGGQSLLLAMKERTATPSVLVSLSSVTGLSGITTGSSGELSVGTTTTYAVLADAALPGWHAEISRMAGDLADRPVRTMGTIGGAICAADPRFDMPVLVMGTGARLEVLGAAGARTIDPSDFFLAGGGTCLSPDEVLTAIHFPEREHYRAVAFEKFRQRQFDAATASVLCALTQGSDGRIGAARIAVGAVAPSPRLCSATTEAMVSGADPFALDLEEVGVAVAAEVLPETDTGTARYHCELVKALTRRALARALSTLGS